MNHRPACTFLLPVFNGAIHLEKSISNLLSSAASQDEILIVNDGSSDCTQEKWDEITALDPRIKVFHQTHQGIVVALNNGVSQSTNEYIARVDIDDSYHSDRIELQVSYLQKFKEAGVVFCDYDFVKQETLESLGSICSPITPNLSLLALVNPQRMPHPGALILKSALLRVGGYRSEDSPCEDYGLWLRIARQYELISVPEVLLSYSISQKGLTAIHSS